MRHHDFRFTGIVCTMSFALFLLLQGCTGTSPSPTETLQKQAVSPQSVSQSIAPPSYDGSYQLKSYLHLWGDRQVPASDQGQRYLVVEGDQVYTWREVEQKLVPGSQQKFPIAWDGAFFRLKNGSSVSRSPGGLNWGNTQGLAEYERIPEKEPPPIAPKSYDLYREPGTQALYRVPGSYSPVFRKDPNAEFYRWDRKQDKWITIREEELPDTQTMSYVGMYINHEGVTAPWEESRPGSASQRPKSRGRPWTASMTPSGEL
jgi:hypothetical protein